MQTKLASFLGLLLLLVVSSCQDHPLVPTPGQIQLTDFASGLLAPLGVAADDKGQLWVTEAGTGNNDGRLSLITPNGSVYPVITGFKSSISPENTPDGLNHLLYKDGMLYILHGVEGKLYKANVSNFKPGDQPMTAAQVPSEDLKTFVLNHDFGPADTGESNVYNLTFGPGGDLFITDAAANAVIRRKTDGTLSVFSVLPSYQNPTPVGPPTVHPVPTGIVFDGDKFLVSTLTGFPFIAGKANLFKIDQAGVVTVFEEGYSLLVDILLTPDKKPLILQFADFSLQQGGFQPGTGRIIRSDNGQKTVLKEGLMMPTDIEKGGPNTYYLTSLATGKVLKLAY